MDATLPCYVVDFHGKYGYASNESRTFPDPLPLMRELPQLTAEARKRRKSLVVSYMVLGLRTQITRLDYAPKRAR